MNELLCAIIGNIENLMPQFTTLEAACEYVYGHRNAPKEINLQIKMQQDCVKKYSTDLANSLYYASIPSEAD